MNSTGTHAKARPGAWRRWVSAAFACAAAHLAPAGSACAADDSLLPELRYALRSDAAAAGPSGRMTLSWTPGSGLPLVKPPRVGSEVGQDESWAHFRSQGDDIEHAPSERPAPGIPRLTLGGTGARKVALVLDRPARIDAPTWEPAPQASTTWAGPCSGHASTERRQCTAAPQGPKGKKGLHHELWFVTIELLAVQSASLAIFAALPVDVSGFAPADIRNIPRFATKGPYFDDDRWGFNYIGHPLAGSEYYLIARNRKAAFWQGLLYAAAFSTFWEYGIEGLYERASIQDLIVTPISGAVLGELRYQLRRALINPATGRADNDMLQLLVVALDPIQAVADAVPLQF